MCQRALSGWSSRPGEFHPQPLTEPYVTVSRHTALHTSSSPRLPIPQTPPVTSWSNESVKVCQPLRSVPVTGTSTLLRADPPLCSASILSASRGPRLRVFSCHQNDRFPRSTQQPNIGSRRLYAGGRMPGNQVPDILIARSKMSPAFDLKWTNLRHLISGSLVFVSRYPT